jgi:hypothetical protein
VVLVAARGALCNADLFSRAQELLPSSLCAGVWRAYDQGVFSAGQGPAYEPWKELT